MFSRPSNTPFVCARCLSRQARRLYATVSASKTAPQQPPPSGAAKLSNRRLISLHGQETPKFLQGIITNNVRTDSLAGFYAAFLTAQGKVLHDTFVYPTPGSQWHKQQRPDDDPGYLVEVDAEQADLLMKHLKRHKLRSKFKLRLIEPDELGIWSLWREGERWTAHGQPKTDEGIISLTDCRAPGMGERLILSDPQVEDALKEVEQSSLEAYTIRRYLRGVPEGQKEMPRDDCLPMNCNIDIMGGIDFKKGCYVGQELTIRTHHTGVVRRRILPVSLYQHGQNAPELLEYSSSSTMSAGTLAGFDIKRDDKRKRSTGKLIAGVGNIGLGMCRLEQMTDLKVSSEPSSFQLEDKFLIQSSDGKEIGVRAFVPDWVRGSIREPKMQKRVE
ncbi:putative transferase caf17, mitochondrial [Pseudocercospora fuligena]|uniref:Iron-sulfur cluster assembly factor IBA57 homolog, mitochondrial n=1 Tax=Pseudocercospora fuligena TaxID=685502 RepID=A0A8H6RSB0_9PEZI|nr:putative transferase caf17, mitochondrial [Pseudocercospora fuligena]